MPKRFLISAAVLLSLFSGLLSIPAQAFTDDLSRGLLPSPQAQNATSESGVVRTNSGLKYQDSKVGSGRVTRKGDTVEVHYTGWFTNGKKFDSSVDRGDPFTFKLGARMVIQGWDEGVAGMKVGGKRKLIIPFKLAYGEEGRPPTIPAKADLIFEVELLKVK